MSNGSDSPLTVNRELLELTAVTVTLVPLAARLPVAWPLVPSWTLPSAIVDGVAVRTPDVLDPDPDNAMVSVGLELFDVSVSVPVELPVL